MSQTTPFNQQPVKRPRIKHKKRKETVSEQQTGFTPEQLREKQMDMRRGCLASYGIEPVDLEPDEISDSAESKERGVAVARPRKGEPTLTNPKTNSSGNGTKVEGSTPATGRHIRVLAATPQIVQRTHHPARTAPQQSERQGTRDPAKGTQHPSALTAAELCKGCGVPLPASGNRGQPRKWCSENCRKLHYEQRCGMCGERTWGQYCQTCYLESGFLRRADSRTKRQRWEHIPELRRQGLLNRQIAALLGVPIERIADDIKVMRKEGVYVPPSPYHQRKPKRKRLRKLAPTATSSVSNDLALGVDVPSDATDSRVD